jgi:hypothetical protein
VFPIETVRRCAACAASTPHRREALPLAIVVGILALASAVVAALIGGAGWDLAAALGAGGTFVALLGVLHSGRARCERCRVRRSGTRRGRGPTLRGNTEINIL